ncbi:MAG: peroxide stress protein YaaA [Candidatus Methanospirareceae archaeon]
MKRVLILIPCSGSKKSGGITEYSTKSSISNYLTSSSREHLLSLRRKLFEYFSIPFGQDVGYPNDGTIKYMEAYKRYAGNIYCQISFSSWEKLRETQNLDLVIVSALYGLLRYDEPIRHYDITMKDKIGYQTLKTWWRNNGLCAILKDYIDENSISEVHNVLSKDYNEALRGCFIDMGAKHSHHDFSEYKSGSNAHRGKWVNDFIQNF